MAAAEAAVVAAAEEKEREEEQGETGQGQNKSYMGELHRRSEEEEDQHRHDARKIYRAEPYGTVDDVTPLFTAIMGSTHL